MVIFLISATLAGVMLIGGELHFKGDTYFNASI